MRIVEAQVISNLDISKSGRFSVYSKAIGELPFDVIYTSPYSAPFDGGFFAIPEEGSFVLITKPDESQFWYFLSCIHKNLGQIDKNHVRKDLKGKELIPETVYAATNTKPQQIIIQDPFGNKLKLSHARSKGYLGTKTELASAGGKKVILNDSPVVNAVVLETELQDRIKITSTPAEGMSAGRSIEAEAVGPIKLISKESDIEVLVVDGREINIENDSTGFNDSGWNPEPEKKFGNINLKSKYKDINLTTLGPDGKVFIRTKGSDSVIQINSNGSVVIKAKDISIEGDSINMKSSGELNLKGSNVNIGGDTVKISGVASDINMNANIAIKGLRVDFNPLIILEKAEEPTTIDTIPNRYGD